MINHFVLIKYREATPPIHVEEFCRRTLLLQSTIPWIIELTIGQDILHEERSWDVILMMAFASVDDLRRYQSHPEHQAVMHLNRPHVDKVATLDFEKPFGLPTD